MFSPVIGPNTGQPNNGSPSSLDWVKIADKIHLTFTIPSTMTLWADRTDKIHLTFTIPSNMTLWADACLRFFGLVLSNAFTSKVH